MGQKIVRNPTAGVRMVVVARSGRQGTTGLHVGNGNVQRLFPPDVPVVELELDHLRIVCTLQPDFWGGEPEIHDARLNAWLDAKRSSGKLAKSPAPVAMIPAGTNAFRLMPIEAKAVRSTKYAVSFVA